MWSNKRFKRFWKISVPLYLVVLLVLNGFLLGLASSLAFRSIPQTSNPEVSSELLEELKRKVLPSGGYETQLTWGDIGKKLVEVGAIDEEGFKELFKSPAEGSQELDILKGNSSKPISINENNSHFVLNALWAFGLTQKSKVLDEGPMKNGEYDLGNFASTAGWTLGVKDALELYSSYSFVQLNDFQQDLVEKIAEGVYRPCCGNHTAFPDCNHGMAALALIELEVAAGIPEEQIYKDLLAFNSFWFSDTYLKMAAYFDEQGTDWADVDPKVALSADYSSAEGAQRVASEVAGVPGFEGGGGSCGI
ncbi:hypothetical protein GTO10_06930 [Candidatus Saccharibacteria bacterium]|nr:hypothetical protein [Candidatus Saccharibacteria bacterium]